MKKFKVFLVVAMFFTLANYSSNACGILFDCNPGGGGGKGGGPHGNPVGAPLDGGLLTILGAAGVTYYLVKKNKNKDNTGI